MAEQKKAYSNIIDQFLDDREPDYEALDLEGAVDSGEQQLDRTHKYVDEAFEDAIGESASSHHTPVWGPRTSSSPSREKANRDARLNAARAAAQEKQRAKEARERGYTGAETVSRTAGHDEDFVNEISDNEKAQKDAFRTPEKAKSKAQFDFGKNSPGITDDAVQRYVTQLLEQGHAPAKVASILMYLASGPQAEFQRCANCKEMIRKAGPRCKSASGHSWYPVAEKIKTADAKVAENQPFFNRQMSQEYLNQMSGLLGYKNLEPNHYMPKNPDTYERMNTKVGEWAGELRSALNRMTAGVPKDKKMAALVRVVQRESERRATAAYRAKTVSQQTGGMVHVAEQEKTSRHFVSIAAIQDAQQKKQARKDAAMLFNANTVESLHKKGNSIQKIYTAASRKVGSKVAGDAVKQFIASLKQRGTKIALSQIDCTFLKQKLGVQNAIVGASKCASCVYRQGMHCGLTGGTLLSFPGMERVASNHKIADGAPKDGHAMLAEFDLQGGYPLSAGDIDIKESSGQMDVEMGSSFSLGDIEF